MPPETTVTKFIVNDNPIYIKTKWTVNEENLFEMQLYDGNHGWIGVFTNESAEKIKKKYEKPENYNDDVKNCLTGDDRSYSINFLPENTIAMFIWSKKFEGLTQVIGSVTLEQDDSVNKLSFIDFLLNENTELKKTLINLKNSTDVVNKDLIKCQEEIIKFVDSKTYLENMLYGKFVQLINTKKRRIQILQDNISNF